MKVIPKIFTIAILLLITMETYSQIGVTNYSIFACGINTSQNHKISSELKVYSEILSSDLLLEIDFFYNFKSKEYHRFSTGIGLRGYPGGNDIIDGLVIPVQLEVYPLQQFKQLSVIYEFSVVTDGETDLGFRNLFGVRYTFNKKSKEQPLDAK